MKKRLLNASCLAGCVQVVIALFPGGAALGEETEKPEMWLDEIVVTAQKREQSLQDVPISVSVFGGPAIAKQNITELGDYFDLTPNIAAVNLGSLIDNQVSVRGVSNIGGAQNVVGFFVDEFNVAPLVENATYDQRLIDVERLEVLRGPQGTLFGRNASGGAISITTKKPSSEFGGYVTAGYSSFKTKLVKAAVNVPVSDTVFVRVNGFLEDSAGFLKNEGPSDATNDYTSYAVRGAVRFQPSEELTVDLALSHQDHEQGFMNSVPTGIQGDTLASLGFPIFTLDAGYFPENNDTIQTDRGRDIKAETTMATARVQYDFENVTLVSVTGIIDHDATINGEADQSGLDLWNDENYIKLNSWSTELRLQTGNDTGFNWLLGGVYAEDKNETLDRRPFSPTFFSTFFGVTVPEGTIVTPINDLETFDVTSFGLFGELSWTGLDDRLTVSAGLRWQHDEVASTFYALRNAVFPPFTAVPQDEAGEASFDSFMPRLTANYAVSDEVSIYGTVSKGAKPGGFNLATVTFPDLGLPETFDSESLWNYEVGMKAVLADRKVLLNLAAFYIDWSKIQVSSFFFDPVTFDSGVVTQNGAEASSKGFEADIAIRPVEGLEFKAAIGYQDSTFGDFPDAIIDSTGNTADASGNRLPLAPEWTYNASAEYNWFMFQDAEAFVRLEYIYRDSVFTDNEARATPPDFVGAYDYLNLRAGFDVGQIRVLAYIENLTGSDYTTGYLPPNSITGVLATVNPRRIGVSVTYDF
ncbi:TonB-dependent receptor [Kordiimonas pumila]|uniref:TonB-dependent receptor n=1 Tax=Kordiimonas pumila TaxID=2161677 RepID=A0ABV7D4E7_9PROT|nr:TonB-dependent receptor [Kordiimonas pumila]